MDTRNFIIAALAEDLGDGDHSTLASISPEAEGNAVLHIKEDGILAGMQIARDIFAYLQPDAQITTYKKDGDRIAKGDKAFEVSARVHTILQAERLVLNCMQRMSGIATLTAQYVEKVKPYGCTILDTRKTTPLFRAMEKEAVHIGGGSNHRMGLYDMVMLKDNHIDFCGGMEKAIARTRQYLADKGLDLKIEVETRGIDDVKRILAVGGIHRIMLDNYNPQLLEEAVKLIDGKYETEASGGINMDNIADYARTGVQYISIGALTHHAVSLDLSLKASIK